MDVSTVKNINYVWQKILMYWSTWNKEDKLFTLRNYLDYIDWEIMSRLIIEEDIIREFKDFIIWDVIGTTDYFSKEFIREFANKLNLQHRKTRWEIEKEFKKL